MSIEVIYLNEEGGIIVRGGGVGGLVVTEGLDATCIRGQCCASAPHISIGVPVLLDALLQVSHGYILGLCILRSDHCRPSAGVRLSCLLLIWIHGDLFLDSGSDSAEEVHLLMSVCVAGHLGGKHTPVHVMKPVLQYRVCPISPQLNHPH